MSRRTLRFALTGGYADLHIARRLGRRALIIAIEGRPMKYCLNQPYGGIRSSWTATTGATTTGANAKVICHCGQPSCPDTPKK